MCIDNILLDFSNAFNHLIQTILMALPQRLFQFVKGYPKFKYITFNLFYSTKFKIN
jgi:hypothetical protein